MIIKLENIDNIFEKDVVATKTTFVEKKIQMERSTLYSFDSPFQLLNADVANLEFLGKSVGDSNTVSFLSIYLHLRFTPT